MSDRWVISHSGKKGGPWEADVGTELGEHTRDPQKRWAKPLPRVAHQICARLRTQGHPHAKVFRLVRRSKPSLTTLERAVVEAAMAWHEPFAEGAHVGLVDISPFETAMDEACAALRAKRGG